MTNKTIERYCKFYKRKTRANDSNELKEKLYALTKLRRIARDKSDISRTELIELLKRGKVYLLYNKDYIYPIATNPQIFENIEKRKFYLGQILGIKTKQDVSRLRDEIKD